MRPPEPRYCYKLECDVISLQDCVNNKFLSLGMLYKVLKCTPFVIACIASAGYNFEACNKAAICTADSGINILACYYDNCSWVEVKIKDEW